MNKKSSSLIGSTRDSVLALCTTNNKIREFDKEEEKKKDEINHLGIEIKEDEESKSNPRPAEKSNEEFKVCVVDESEYVYIFDNKSGSNPKNSAENQYRIKDCKELPQEIKDKDLFGMGYPYFVTYYDNRVAVSADYGVCLLYIPPK